MLDSSIDYSPQFIFLDDDVVSGSSSVEPETAVSSDGVYNQLVLTNSILTGIVLLIGVIVGCIGMGIFFNRFHK